MINRTATTFVLLLALVSTNVFAQGALREKQRMAEALERSGDNRGASRLWQELFEADGNNGTAYGGVVRTLLALKQDASLLPLVEQYARAHKHTASMLLAGTLAWRLGKTDVAEQWWKDAIASDNSNAEVYALLAHDFASLTLHQRAIDTYLKARSLTDENEFAAPLAALYATTGNVPKGADEILRLYSLTGDVQQTKGLLSSLMTTPENTAFLKGVLNSHTDSKYSTLVLRQWFARETRDWNTALEITRELDAERKARGQEILLFADGARLDGEYDIAIKAYGEVLALTGVASNTSLSAAYGSTRTLEQKLKLQSTTPTKADAQDIIDRYAAIVKQYPQHPIAADALLNIAQLTDEVLRDPVEAMSVLQRLANTYKGTTAAADGVLHLSSIYITTTRLDLAEAVLDQLIVSPTRNNPNQRELALLRKADLLLFKGQTDSARAIYTDLATRPASPAANNALERSLLLTLAQDDSAAVKIYIQATLKDLQRKPDEAADMFMQASKAASDAELRDQSMFEAARTRLVSGNDAAAQPLLKTLTASTPESLYADRAMFLLAEILERRGDNKGALEMLTNLIVQYPRSIHVPEARTRIRRLRGDV
ncbi:MAG: tetratricopeptide repeat protein [bacterium]|nr:tetratricopeptide repeat protein [bacterium]